VSREMITHKSFQSMDHKTLIFAGNRETETPVMKPKNIEILGNTSQAGLKDQAHRA
jgi:hypothetical protein